jgi:hypothetical protein
MTAVGQGEYAVGGQEDFGILVAGTGPGTAKIYGHPQHFYADFGSRDLNYIHVAAVKEWGVVVAFHGVELLESTCFLGSLQYRLFDS